MISILGRMGYGLEDTFGLDSYLYILDILYSNVKLSVQVSFIRAPPTKILTSLCVHTSCLGVLQTHFCMALQCRTR